MELLRQPRSHGAEGLEMDSRVPGWQRDWCGMRPAFALTGACLKKDDPKGDGHTGQCDGQSFLHTLGVTAEG